jgi:hypothetical protein
MLDRDDSPWYPTMRLFRRHANRDWNAVVDSIRQEIERMDGIARTGLRSAGCRMHGASVFPRGNHDL